MKSKYINTLKETVNWFIRTMPENNEPVTEKSITVQIAVHFEEVSEMLKALSSYDDGIKSDILIACDSMERLSERLKAYSSNAKLFLRDPSGQEMLDAITDQIVTAAGVGTLLRMNVVGSLNEVNRSNYSKFDDEGKPIRNESGKIVKGPNYSPPYLKPYIPEPFDNPLTALADRH